MAELGKEMDHQDKPILCVGLVCVDIVTTAKSFPLEDTDQRCADQCWQRGGNAANTSAVLSMLGKKGHFMGTLGGSIETGFLCEDFQANIIDTSNCILHKESQCPVSIVIINQQNGSRTILHSNKNLPEVTYDDFKKVDLSRFRWVHFEGRPSVPEMIKMLDHIDCYNKTASQEEKVTTSVELEKVKPELVDLADKADYVFVSKEHGLGMGCKTKEETVQVFSKKIRHGATVICPWGEDGAIGKGPDGKTYSSPIFSPKSVVDTLGAGDTFIAACILALSYGRTLEHSITIGCKVAGTKCGMKGYHGLKNLDWKVL